MTTMADVVAGARRSIYGSLPDKINLLTVAYGAGDTEVHLGMDVTGIRPGTVLCSGLNTWIVREIDTSTKIATVLQYDGSPSTAGNVDDIVYASPRITDWYLFSKAAETIKQLSTPNNGLYRVVTWDADVDPVFGTYAVPSGVSINGILQVKVTVPGTDDVWDQVPLEYVEFLPEQRTVQIATGMYAGATVTFTGKASFVEPTSLSDDLVAVCGLPPTATDIPELGAIAAHLRTMEGRRNQMIAQGDPRRAEEVSPGSNMGLARLADLDLRNRIADERALLMARYPWRR